jgi:hypothetical protein
MGQCIILFGYGVIAYLSLEPYIQLQIRYGFNL